VPRFYDVAAAALTVGAPVKWIDNLLSRYQLDGVEQKRQGVTRRISDDGLLRLAIVRILTEELGLPIGRAVTVARRMTTERDDVMTLGEGTVTLRVERRMLARQIAMRAADAVESAPRRSRGRPPRT
jgi:hypothetical protein